MALRDLDPLLSHSKLKLMATVLDKGGSASFVDVARDAEMPSYGTLSAHNEDLEREGYVELRRTFVGKRTRTLIVATEKGRDKFNRHVAALLAAANISAEREAA